MRWKTVPQMSGCDRKCSVTDSGQMSIVNTKLQGVFTPPQKGYRNTPTFVQHPQLPLLITRDVNKATECKAKARAKAHTIEAKA